MEIAEQDTRLKYKKVEKEIRKLIEQSEKGARLPSERKLADLLGVSFLTVRRGLQLLVDEGRIEKKAGNGTFVADKKKGGPAGHASAGAEKIGLLVFRDSDAFAHKILHAIDELSTDEGIALRHVWISDLGDQAVRRVRELKAEGVHALIFPWIPPSFTSGEGATQLQRFIESSPLPVTLAPLIPGMEQYCFQNPSVYGADLISSTETFCAYFSLLGHKRIALLGPDDTENLLFQKRIVGYTYFVSRLGLEHFVSMISLKDKEMNALADRWKKYRGDLAVISYDDDYALKFMEFMGKRGLYAPKDFCIIGFNNTEESRRANPPLTTVLPNYKDSARDLMKSAIASVTGKTSQTLETPSPLTFIVRESCGGRKQVERIVREMGNKLDIVCER